VGGKPNPGTKKDKRLAGNSGKKTSSKKGFVPFSKGGKSKGK
jgi:hypothetical protein